MLKKFKVAASVVAFTLLAACGGGGGDPSSDSRPSVLATELDGYIQPYLTANGITAATVAVMQNGQLLYEKAYGYKDVQATTPLPADALLTGASIVKPVTAAAINWLQLAGLVSANDLVFCPANSPSRCWVPNGWVTAADPRIFTIRVQDLISHKGGWDRGAESCRAFNGATASSPGVQALLRGSGLPCDMLQHDALVRGDLGLNRAPNREETIRYVMATPLDYDPGQPTGSVRDRYSNFGYMLLGYIIEQASGQSYNSYVNAQILSPLGVSSNDFKNGNSLLSEADPREPNYITTMQTFNVFDNGLVNARNGGVNAINWVSTATSLMTARAMARFASAYKIDTDANGVDGPFNGQPLSGTTNDGFHGGDLPGSAALLRQLRSGISYAILMNKNDKFEGSGVRRDYPGDMKTGIDRAITRAGY
jgi:CubicO group peptidase (beta-lactamase class C family)